MTKQYTPAQLEAWAELGPWEWQKLAEFSSPKYSLGPGVLLTDERDGTPWGDTIDQTNAALIAAAPDLARLVLEKEKEIARLENKVEFWRGCTELARLKLEEFSIDLKRWISHQYDEPQAMKETGDD